MSDNPLDAYRFDPETIVHRTPEHATRDDIVVIFNSTADVVGTFRSMQRKSKLFRLKVSKNIYT